MNFTGWWRVELRVKGLVLLSVVIEAETTERAISQAFRPEIPNTAELPMLAPGEYSLEISIADPPLEYPE